MERLFSKDAVGGVCLVAVGALGLWGVQDLPIEELRRMGPGYFPAIVSTLLILVGIAIASRPLWTRPEAIAHVDWRAFLVTSASIVFFAFALRPLGVLIATAGLVSIVSLASPGIRWRTILVLSMVLPAIVIALFVFGLGIPLTIWPS